MPISNFPPIELADEHGLLAVGGDLEVASLLLAYKRGIFPWPINEDYPLAWFSPDPRGIIYTRDFYLSRTMKKTLRHAPYTVSYNTAFDQIIQACRATHERKQSGQTWITQEICSAYSSLHRAGHAYSVEVFDQNQKLVGGLYGVCLGGYVSGESMFYHSPNASKIALATLLIDLKENEIPWIDTQMVTPVVGSMGGVEIPRSLFLNQLKEVLKIETPSFLRKSL
jgi:leucyl/phenylalanyl-tRNA---protein transferase